MEAQTVLAEDPALSAYEGLAAHYDELTAGYDYETWLGAVEALALEHGLQGRRLLDVACGTGKSFEPLAGRGYEVAACDLSPAMVELARAKAPPGSQLFVADMRALPVAGRFDLVTCLDDSLNYVLDRAGLEAAIGGMAANLAPGGLLAFDLNSLGTYRRVFGRDSIGHSDGRVFCWRGEPSADPRPGERFTATIDVFSEERDELWSRSRTTHWQRHHPRVEVERALALAGLELVEARGQLPGARLEPEPDEERHQKLFYLAKKGR
jgi:SAM-dependent methyltransferase